MKRKRNGKKMIKKNRFFFSPFEDFWVVCVCVRMFRERKTIIIYFFFFASKTALHVLSGFVFPLPKTILLNKKKKLKKAQTIVCCGLPWHNV